MLGMMGAGRGQSEIYSSANRFCPTRAYDLFLFCYYFDSFSRGRSASINKMNSHRLPVKETAHKLKKKNNKNKSNKRFVNNMSK